MAQVGLTITKFVNPDDSPVANGSLTIRLSQDGSVNDTQVQSVFTRIPLDAGGNVLGSPVFWPNNEISPPNTYYILRVYAASGQLVSGPNIVTV